MTHTKLAMDAIARLTEVEAERDAYKTRLAEAERLLQHAFNFLACRDDSPNPIGVIDLYLCLRATDSAELTPKEGA